MELPLLLREELERLLEAENTNTLARSAEEISQKYRQNTGSGARLAASENDIKAYAAVRMPATFGAVYRALSLSLECFEGEISTVLDIGAGTGAASHAAFSLLDCEKITCIEREPQMLSLGSFLSEKCGLPAQWHNIDINLAEDFSGELVVCSYCLNEIADKNSAVSKMWSMTEKMLLIVEPGTPQGFRNIKAARERLLSLGAKIAAPCPHAGECPLDSDDWCHFTARVARSRLHKQLKGGSVPYEDEKFSFIAAVRAGENPCEGRILRHPDIQSGKIGLRICASTGISAENITRKSTYFKAARKSAAGDKFPPNGI